MNKSRQIRTGTAVGVGIAVALSLSACNDKATEQFRDAPIANRDRSAAEVYDMPDGFSNFSEKCDGHGNRVFVAFHNDSSYAAIAVVRDPTCG